MSKSRIKIALPLLASRDEAEAAMNELALCANNKRKLTARLDAAVLKLQEEAAAGLSQCDQELNAKSDALRAWAEANPDEFAKGRKSIDFLSGTLGFRTGTPKLSLISRAWNWNKVLEAIKSSILWGACVRKKEEVDKERIITRATSGAQLNLAVIGLKVVQEESFYVEPKLTDTSVS